MGFYAKTMFRGHSPRHRAGWQVKAGNGGLFCYSRNGSTEFAEEIVAEIYRAMTRLRHKK
jgi:hypothetical protein